ncbi:hypothetical protein ACH42_08905 [Endozoicomonas sp. (ex Bugula neritina AB1)]|nr:hypothetical protein ACH42_08905 [Endozoicomonas sp. (ex Bugula neritina AB1)]
MSNSTSQNRAQVYWWLSSLIAAELDEKQLQILFSKDINTFLEALAEESELSDAVSKLKQSIYGLRTREDVQLELAADYAKLFLGTGKQGALPYASIYLSKDGLLMQEPHHQMVKLLHDNGFAQAEGFNEPADHLAIILDFMGNLAVKDMKASIQKHCLNEHLLSWLPRWQKDAEKHDIFGFYAATALLILEFIKMDSDFMQA